MAGSDRISETCWGESPPWSGNWPKWRVCCKGRACGRGVSLSARRGTRRSGRAMPKRSWLSCPDCEAAGYKWCGSTGLWPNPTPKGARATARILRVAGQGARAAKYEAEADLLETERDRPQRTLFNRCLVGLHIDQPMPRGVKGGRCLHKKGVCARSAGPLPFWTSRSFRVDWPETGVRPVGLSQRSTISRKSCGVRSMTYAAKGSCLKSTSKKASRRSGSRCSRPMSTSRLSSDWLRIFERRHSASGC